MQSEERIIKRLRAEANATAIDEFYEAAALIESLELGWKQCSGACAVVQGERDAALLKLGAVEKERDDIRIGYDKCLEWYRAEADKTKSLESRLGELLEQIRRYAGDKEWDSPGGHVSRGRGYWWCSECDGSIDTGHKDPCVRKYAFLVETHKPNCGHQHDMGFTCVLAADHEGMHRGDIVWDLD